jgi:hypothetical protein
MEAQNLEQVPQGSQQLAPSNKTFEAALQNRNILQDYDGLTSALQYSMMLAGIRANNAPTQAEFDFLKYYLIKNFGRHTAAEIRLAFDLAFSGQLQLGIDGAKCFENFSCEYVGRILNAYRKWAELQHKEIPNDPPANLLEYTPNLVNWAEEFELLKQAAKDGTIDKCIIVTTLYDWLVENGMLNLTGPEKKHFYLSARESIINELTKARHDGAMLSSNDVADLTALLSIEWIKNESVKVRLQNRAKILAVKWLAAL